MRMRKSESVCSFCLARRNVTDPVCEPTRSQDGPQEKIGIAPFVPQRTRQMPGQPSWPLRNGCRKKWSSEGIWTRLCCKYRSSRFDLIPKPYSHFSYFIREHHFHFQGLGISGWEYGFSMGEYWYMRLRLGFLYVVVYGSSNGSILWVLLWVFW